MRFLFYLVLAFISSSTYAQINSARDSQDSKLTIPFKPSFSLPEAPGLSFLRPDLIKLNKGKKYFNMPVYSPKNIASIPIYIPDNFSKMTIKAFKEENKLWKK